MGANNKPLRVLTPEETHIMEWVNRDDNELIDLMKREMEMERPIISTDRIIETIKVQTAHLMEQIEKKGSVSWVSKHEALGIVNEEHHELIHAVQSNNIEDIRSELLDIATACIFGIACIDEGHIK